MYLRSFVSEVECVCIHWHQNNTTGRMLEAIVIASQRF